MVSIKRTEIVYLSIVIYFVAAFNEDIFVSYYANKFQSKLIYYFLNRFYQISAKQHNK